MIIEKRNQGDPQVSLDQQPKPGHTPAHAISAIGSGDPFSTEKLGYAVLTEDGPDPVAAQVRQAVDRQLDAPASTTMQAIESLPGPEFVVAHHQHAIETAQEAGLQLVDDRPYAEQLRQTETIPQALEVLNAYTKQHGFKVEIGDDVDLSAITPEQFRDGAEALMANLFYLPREVTKLIDLDELEIKTRLSNVDGSIVGEGVSAAGEADPLKDKIRLTMEAFTSGHYETVIHELGHRLDGEIGGAWGSDHDKAFTKLNPPGFKYGDPNNPYINETTTTDYGATNQSEDKAEYYESMLTGLKPDLVQSDSPTIRNKYRELLGRVEERVPGVTQYLAGISSPRMHVTHEISAEQIQQLNSTTS